MRLVFAGTPEPALPSLQRLIDSDRHEVIAVMTRPDAVAGRRGRPSPSPVAQLAAAHGIPVLKPARPNSGEFVAELSALSPDCCAVVAYGALWLTRPLYGETGYFRRVPPLLRLLFFFLQALWVSNLRVLAAVLAPSRIQRSGIIRVPLAAQSDLEIMLVANLISLTPGTLSVDLSEDRRLLYVHVLFLDDPETARQELKNGLERRVLEVLR